MKHSELSGQRNDKTRGYETFNSEKQFSPVA